MHLKLIGQKKKLQTELSGHHLEIVLMSNVNSGLLFTPGMLMSSGRAAASKPMTKGMQAGRWA